MAWEGEVWEEEEGGGGVGGGGGWKRCMPAEGILYLFFFLFFFLSHFCYLKLCAVLIIPGTF